MNPGTIYDALIADGKRLGSLRRVQYRCANPKRLCLLLDAVVITPGPDGTILHQQRYKLSHHINDDRSTEAGRRRNTYDGANHWQARTYLLSDSALAYPDDIDAAVTLTCDHVLEYRLTAREFRRDIEAGNAEIRVRADGTRSVVA